MEDKHQLYIIAIVAIIAIVGVIIMITSRSQMNTGTVTEDVAGQATRASSEIATPTKIVNAHSCNADGTCETNSINGKKGIFNMLVVGSYNLNEKPVLVADNALFRLAVHGETDFTRGVTFHSLMGEPIKFANLQGSDNAYACLNNEGVLYRSETPCTGTSNGGLTTQDILNVLNSCKYYGGTLAEGQDCNAVCTNPSVWGQSESPGTCITGEFLASDAAYPSSLVRCEFKEAGRQLTCVCCTP